MINCKKCGEVSIDESVSLPDEHGWLSIEGGEVCPACINSDALLLAQMYALKLEGQALMEQTKKLMYSIDLFARMIGTTTKHSEHMRKLIGDLPGVLDVRPIEKKN